MYRKTLPNISKHAWWSRETIGCCMLLQNSQELPWKIWLNYCNLLHFKIAVFSDRDDSRFDHPCPSTMVRTWFFGIRWAPLFGVPSTYHLQKIPSSPCWIPPPIFFIIPILCRQSLLNHAF
jgi:hypothetical protein